MVQNSTFTTTAYTLKNLFPTCVSYDGADDVRTSVPGAAIRKGEMNKRGDMLGRHLGEMRGNNYHNQSIEILCWTLEGTVVAIRR